MDIVGVLLMTGALICFILGLTQGPIDGWGSASFIAPFIIAFVIGPLFFVWGEFKYLHLFTKLRLAAQRREFHLAQQSFPSASGRSRT